MNHYFNCASSAPLHAVAQEAMLDFQKEWLSGTYVIYPDCLHRSQQLKEKLGTCFGFKADRLAIIPNVSMGMSMAAQGMTWQPGDEIVMLDDGYPSTVYAFRALEAQGVVIRWVSFQDYTLNPTALEKAIRPKTRALVLSFVGYMSGYAFDLEAIGRLCCENDVRFIVDATQGVGAVDLRDYSFVDMLLCGGYKWLMWPPGLGFMYLSESMLELLTPTVLGCLSYEDPYDIQAEDPVLFSDARRFESGIMNVQGVVAANAMMDYFIQEGLDSIYQRISDHANVLWDILSERGQMLWDGADRNRRSGIVSVTFSEQTEVVYQELVKQGAVLTHRHEYLRFSPPFYQALNRDQLTAQLDKAFSVVA